MTIETIWFLVVGGVLIVMGLASSTFKQLPISSAMVYLAIGFIVILLLGWVERRMSPHLRVMPPSAQTPRTIVG